MSTAKKQRVREFDENKLANLTEPISIYLERQTSGRRQPIDLPKKDGEEYPGKGWTQDEVRNLPMFALKWCGGGLYTAKATGGNGETLEWDFYFPPQAAPEWQPPTATAQPPSPGAPVLPFPQMQPPTTPNWLDQAAAAAQFQRGGGPQAQAQVPMSYFSQNPGYNPYLPPTPFGGYGGGLSSQGFLGARFGQGDDQRYQTEREARLALEAKIERERAEQAHQLQLSSLTAEVRKLQEKRPDDESPAVRAAQAQVAALSKQLEQSQFAQQMTAMQQNFTQTIAEIRASTQQQIAALQAAITQAPKGPDPVMMMLTESMKAQAQATAEAARVQASAATEIARLQADAARESARNAFGPQHVVDLMMRAQTGTEHLSTAYRGALDMVTTAAETMMNMHQPSVHPALEMVGQAAQGGLGILQQYVAGKGAAEQAKMQATAQVAMAQQMAMRQGQQPGQIAPAPGAAQVAPQAANNDEAAYFGPALQAVQQFRAAVASGNVDPARAAQGIVQAIDYFAGQGQVGNVRAFDLWKKGELAELVDALLPGTKSSYREQTTQQLFALIQQLRSGQAKPAAAAKN